jgi:hypothetical protein
MEADKYAGLSKGQIKKLKEKEKKEQEELLKGPESK